MIIARAPLRISFAGGGTDLPDVYRVQDGAVFSATINKYITVAAHRAAHLHEYVLKYSVTEIARTLEEVQHTRLREALRLCQVDPGVEIASFADMPTRIGLGSSSSFSVACLRALMTLKGRSYPQAEFGRMASELEIDILGEPIGKQDQYAAACGGFNIIRFKKDDSVVVEPIFIGHTARKSLEAHCLLVYLGIQRSAGEVLTDQRAQIVDKYEVYAQMSASVDRCAAAVERGDVDMLGAMLHEGWLQKRTLSGRITTSIIDTLYEAGLHSGALGGKLLGAGGGGCMLFIAPPSKHAALRSALSMVATENSLTGFSPIPFVFTQAGVETLLQ